jgi:glycosyltransferase involved in cell wall biosynthesis
MWCADSIKALSALFRAAGIVPTRPMFRPGQSGKTDLKLLHVLSSVNPNGGGPTEGVRQRGIRLQQLGHSVEVVTLDDPGREYLKEFPLTVHALGPTRGSYGYNPKLVPWLRANARKFDAVIVNGMWQYHSFAAWRALQKLGVPYYVFTHGMLDPWFKRTYPFKHLKKWLYWPWADYRVLRDARAVLFTSEEERLQARQSFWLYRAEEQVVAYGTSAPPDNAAELRELFLAKHPELRGRRILLFLGRIHVKKGCDLLIQAFAGVAAAEPNLHLIIAGPDQTGWANRLKELARDLGVAERVSFPGMLRDEMKWGAFYSAEAFVLPSHQENFGIAVAEALGCGVPALISDKVNIWREILSREAGLVAPDTLPGTSRLLSEWLSLTGAQREAMGERARELFRRHFTVDAMAASLLEVVARHARPVEAMSA